MIIYIKKPVRLPDPVKTALYQRCPDLGPRILFFSGGTALRKTSAQLVQYTHNTIHIITPFDSGGSSARLRAAFQMPAIGDVRNRLLALADRSLHGNPQILALFSHRFPPNGNQDELFARLLEMIRGSHPLVSCIPDPMRKIIRLHLLRFSENMPKGFDLAKASIGNLILTGGYLENRGHMDPVIYIFSKLVQVRGTVRPVVNADLHLAAELADGQTVKGQHRITGKETAPLTQKIRRLHLIRSLSDGRPVVCPIRKKMKKQVARAELICYPMGSFYSSLVANLLPKGVGEAVKNNPCPKVYIPNTGCDPEQKDTTVMEQILRLVSYLRADDPETIQCPDVLNFVLVDLKNGEYSGQLHFKELEKMGIVVIDCALVSQDSAPLIDEKLLAPVLVSLI